MLVDVGIVLLGLNIQFHNATVVSRIMSSTSLHPIILSKLRKDIAVVTYKHCKNLS